MLWISVVMTILILGGLFYFKRSIGGNAPDNAVNTLLHFVVGLVLVIIWASYGLSFLV